MKIQEFCATVFDASKTRSGRVALVVPSLKLIPQSWLEALKSNDIWSTGAYDFAPAGIYKQDNTPDCYRLAALEFRHMYVYDVPLDCQALMYMYTRIRQKPYDIHLHYS